jgi:elongation factor P--(R)-beta-lysine ligase
MSDWRSGCSAGLLRKRAELLQKVRSFFDKQGVLEVDTPAISRFPAIDLHLDPLTVNEVSAGPVRYLITSPEYHMKRLLCAGSGSIFQICKAFRQDESGQRHNPEFTMIEWYRAGWDHWQLMDEVDALMQVLLGCAPADRISYCDMFQQQAGVDPFSLTTGSFLNCCEKHALSPPGYLTGAGVSNDDRLNFLMGALIEPSLGAERPVFLHSYPASQASLARINLENPLVSERFEVFYKGMELGNGFHELADAMEQASRFENENRLREKIGKLPFAVDDAFLAALNHGLPDCAGIAMGFDRLVMLALGLDDIEDVIPFSWDRS